MFSVILICCTGAYSFSFNIAFFSFITYFYPFWGGTLPQQNKIVIHLCTYLSHSSFNILQSLNFTLTSWTHYQHHSQMIIHHFSLVLNKLASIPFVTDSASQSSITTGIYTLSENSKFQSHIKNTLTVSFSYDHPPFQSRSERTRLHSVCNRSASRSSITTGIHTLSMQTCKHSHFPMTITKLSSIPISHCHLVHSKVTCTTIPAFHSLTSHTHNYLS